MDEKQLITIETFPEFRENHGNLGALVYLDTTEAIITSLEVMLENGDITLKDKLKSFCEDRKKFIYQAGFLCT